MTDINIQILLFPLRGENPMPYIVFLGRLFFFKILKKISGQVIVNMNQKSFDFAVLQIFSPFHVT